MNGKDIYTEKSGAEKKALRKEFSRLHPLPTVWKIVLIIAFCFAAIGIAFQIVFLVTGSQHIWMSVVYLLLFGTWTIVYSIYVFRVMLKQYKEFYNWIENNQE